MAAEEDLANLHLRARAYAFDVIRALSRTRFGSELKIMMYLAGISNPLTHIAESSEAEISDFIHSSERHVRRALDSLEDGAMVVRSPESGPLKTVYHLLFLDTTAFPTPVMVTGVAVNEGISTPVMVTGVSAGSESTPVMVTGVSDPVQVPFPGMDMNKSRARQPSRGEASLASCSLQQQLASLLSVEISRMQRAYPNSAFGQALVTDSLIRKILHDGSMSTEEDVASFSRYVRHQFVKLGRQPGYASGPTSLGLLVPWAKDFSALKQSGAEGEAQQA